MTKPTWVFNCGIYRSASTTQYQITRDIVEAVDRGRGIGYHSRKKLQANDVPNDGKYIVCKAFVFLPSVCRMTSGFLDENRLKAVCSIRDPRDVIASMKVRHNRHFADPFPTRHRITVDLPQWLRDLQQWVETVLRSFWVLTYQVTRPTRSPMDILSLPSRSARISGIGMSGKTNTCPTSRTFCLGNRAHTGNNCRT